MRNVYLFVSVRRAHPALAAYINAYEKTFKYLGMHFGGFIHANCCAGYKHDEYKSDVEEFIRKSNSSKTSLNSGTQVCQLTR
jgi:hypothetical protein